MDIMGDPVKKDLKPVDCGEVIGKKLRIEKLRKEKLKENINILIY
jgi:hypothetical protein